MKSSTTPNNSSKENPMDSGDLLKQIFDRYLDVHKGAPKVTEFKKFIDVIIKTEIRPLCKRQGKSAGDGSWRSEQKANFAGRGAKWVKLKLEDIEATLARFEANEIDCTEYRSWIAQAGFAWVRYSGPRVDNGVGQAAFEVRTGGSKDDHPKQLHYMSDNNLMEHVESLGGTPHALNLETIAKASDDEEAVSEVPVSDAVEVSDETPRDEVVLEVEADVIEETVTAEEVIEAEEVVSSAPTSDDPAEWEAFLEAEGLGANQFEGDDEDLFASYED
jgi:hypothetical protein